MAATSAPARQKDCTTALDSVHRAQRSGTLCQFRLPAIPGAYARSERPSDYMDALRNGAPFSQLIREIENSPEAEQRRQHLEAERAYCVSSVYQQYLGYTPDPNGLQHYVDALRNGAPFSHLIREIENSPEAEQRRQHLEAERAYCVSSMYRQYLGRTPDPNGHQHYVDALRNGAPFSHLIREMENSPEAEQRRQQFGS
jgi:type VI protein secretion system component VasF